jgi:hypothetical protein
MRLGKEEAQGFIEEPVEVSSGQHAPDEAEPHRAQDAVEALQHAPRNAPEDQTAPTR